jgi:uncharacterized protein YjhX (UPF0386 family)
MNRKKFLNRASRLIMNPIRTKMLRIIAERREKEATAMYLHNITGCKLDRCNLAVRRFAEFGLIRFTGGGYFVITEKGLEYLRSIND